MIKAINWIITDKCNSMCRHCDIWQGHDKQELSLDSINKILGDDIIRESYGKYGAGFDISLGGGEPFLRDDLQEIVSAIEKRYPGSLKTISTNALLTKRILVFIKNNTDLNFKLNISLDGTEKVHDNIRGLKGAFRKTIKTIVLIRKLFPSQPIELKLTLTPNNYDQIIKVYKLALKLGCNFSFKPAENMKNYTNKIKDISLNFTDDQLCIIRNQAFKLADIMYHQMNYKKAKFYRDIPFYLANKKRPEHCSVLGDDITIMPNGDCFFCIKENKSGNLIKENVKDMISHRSADFVCKSCMLMCGAYKDYSNDFFEKKAANIETTLSCNLRCEMCTQKELRENASADMSISRFRDLIEKYKEISHVSFVGGEPFLNKDFFRMMDYLDYSGITYEITTNGTLLDQNVFKKLKGCIGLKRINFSVDGLRNYHNKERGDGVFEKCINALKLTKNILDINVCTVMKENNLDEIPKLTEYLIKHGVKNQKIIYCMNLSKKARIQSMDMVHDLEIKGPFFKKEANDHIKIKTLFEKLNQLSLDSGIKIDLEPKLMKDNPEFFLNGRVFLNNLIFCKQLDQLRFNCIGERIICEFIRNNYSERLSSKIRDNLLPICRYCCKLQLKNSREIKY